MRVSAGRTGPGAGAHRPCLGGMALARNNAFTLLRLLLASAVVFSHSYTLGGFGPDPLARWCGGQMNFGNLAVAGFFAVSGFLLTHSLAGDASVARFCVHRAARILPGYWMALLLSALVLAPALIAREFPGRFSFGEMLRLGPHSALEYLAHNWTLRTQQYTIGPLFAGNAGGHAVNGSLWTLYHEAMCYAGLLLLAVSGGLKPRVTLVLFAAVYGMQVLDFTDHAAFVQISPLAAMAGQFFSSALMRPLYLGFLAGMLVRQLDPGGHGKARWVWVALAVLAASIPAGLLPIAWPLTLPVVLLHLARRLPLGGAGRLGDWSYGIYIYAFPIQQCLALAGVPRFGVAVFFAASLALAFFAGAMSWHLVESPVLQAARGMLAKRRPCAEAMPEPAPG